MILNNWLLSVQQTAAEEEIPVNSAGLYTWGLNNFGQLGHGTTITEHAPRKVGLNSWIQVSVGNSHTLAIRSDYKLFAWGINTSGRLGDGTVINRSSPVQIGSESWLFVSAGLQSSAAIHSNGALFTWGGNSLGDLGDGTTIGKVSPVKIGSESWSQVSLGQETVHAAAIRSDGSLWGWGSPIINGGFQTSSPVSISSSSWNAVSAGYQQVVALDSTNKLYTFGLIGSPGNYYTDIATGEEHSLGIRSDGSLWAWGSNIKGQLGDSSLIDRLLPRRIGSSSWVAVAAYLSTSYAIRSDGALFAWGAGSLGQIGDGVESRNIFDPVIQSPSVTYSWKELVGSTNRFAGLTSDGALWIWGNNESGQVGDRTSLNRSSPVKLGLNSWTHLSLGSNTTAAIRSDGTLWMWGSNLHNKLGLGFGVPNQSSPVQIGTSTWNDVSTASNNHTVAVDTNNTLYAWGDNLTGQMGQGQLYINATDLFTNNVVEFDMLSGRRGLITDTGKLYVWGSNPNGQIGDGTTITKSSPVQIGADRSWSKIFIGAPTYAITNTGTLFAWGSASSGLLGDGTTINKSSPVQIGNESWATIATTFSHTLGILSNGALYAWGLNANGQLGDGTVVSKSSPVKIGNESWAKITVAYSSSAAIHANGALFTWGAGTNGQLGDGTVVSKSSPVKIGTFSWISVNSGKSFDNYWATRNDGDSANGTLYAWGSGLGGSIGNNSTLNRSAPIQIQTGSSFKLIAGTAAVRANGQYVQWGDNTFGDYGDGTTVVVSSPVAITTIQPIANSITKLITGNLGTGKAAILSNGTVFIWGGVADPSPNPAIHTTLHRSSPVSISTGNVRFTPMQVGSNTNWANVTTGNGFTLALTTDYKLFGWGRNDTAQLGVNPVTTSIGLPILVDGSDSNSWIQISTGDSHSLAMNSTNTLFSWGNSQFGQVGYVIDEFHNSPANIWSQIVVTARDVRALDVNGKYYAWGDLASSSTILNERGIAGPSYVIQTPTKLSDETWSSLSPEGAYLIHSNSALFSATTLQKIGSASWSSVSAGFHTLGIQTDGSLWAWGLNNVGQLGDNTSTTKNTPTKIGGSSWAKVVASAYNSIGITIDGAIFGWGEGAYGSVGDGNTFNRSSPVAVSTLSSTDGLNALSLAAGSAGSGETVGLVLANGALYLWGRGSSGQIGNNSTPVDRSVPFKLGAESWAKVAIAGNVLGLLANNKLYIWGLNTNGQIGDGTTINKSSPVAVGTLDWSSVMSVRWNTGGIAGTLSMAANSQGYLHAWGVGANSHYARISDGISVSRSSPVVVGQITGIQVIPKQVNSFSWNYVAAGSSHTVGVTSNGALYAWGLNANGQLGNGNTLNRSSPTKIGNSSWSIVGAANIATIAALSGAAGFPNQYTLFTWGANTSGVLTAIIPNTTTVSRSSPVQIGVLDFRPSPVQIGTLSWAQIAAGRYRALGVLANGQVYAWGDNGGGALADATQISRSSPVLASTLVGKSWTQISAGGEFVSGIDSNGYLYQWGDAGFSLDAGKLGVGSTVGINSDPGSWSAVAAAFSGTVGIRSNGSLFTWGTAIWSGTTLTESSPVQIGSGISFTKLSAKNTHGGAIAQNGALYMFGTNNVGQLGNGTTVEGFGTTYGVPNKIGAQSWAQIAAGPSHTIAIHSNGALYVWGLNNVGQLGDGTTINKSSPVQIGSDSWIAVDAGGFMTGGIGGHSLAIRSDGALFAWGYNSGGQLGDGLTTNKSSPVKIGSDSWSLISAGTTHSIAVQTNGSLFTWGSNVRNQLGDGSTINKSSPVQIGVGTSWAFINASLGDGGPNWAVAANGSLHVWGRNTTGSGTGMFGEGTTAVDSRYTSPVLISGYGWSSWNSIATGSTHVAAISSIGELFTWGSNPQGQLGTGTTIARNIITQQGITSRYALWPNRIGYSSWTQISSAHEHSIGLAADGSIYTWGLNRYGNLGQNVAIDQSSPVKIGTDSWTYVGAGAGFTQAVRSDGRLWAWGVNADGQLGDGTTVSKSSPVSVGINNNWWKVYPGRGQSTAGTFSIMSVKDGRIFAVGNNQRGQLGDGTTL